MVMMILKNCDFFPDEKAALGYCVNYDQSLMFMLTGSKYRHCTHGRIIQ